MKNYEITAVHTAGPWSEEVKGSKIFIDGEDGLTVAYLDRAGVREKMEIEANARLIAAAPELLAALEKIDSNAAESVEWIRRIARAAIAKAQGQS